MIKTWSTPVGDEARKAIPCAICGGERFAKALTCEGFTFVRCRHCGLIQSNPQPTREAIALRYGPAHGEDYLSYELANEESFLRLQTLALGDAGIEELESLFDRTGRDPGGPRVLDVGSATGALLEHLGKRGWQTTGVELSAAQAAYAKEKRGLDIRNTTVEEAGFPAAHFDLVHASHLIEHLNEPSSFIREAHRILKPNGRLILVTPNVDGLQARLFGNHWRSAIFDHLYLFSKKTLSNLLTQEGFSVELTASWGGLAAGTAPRAIKAVADRAAKRWGFGDVVLIRAKK